MCSIVTCISIDKIMRLSLQIWLKMSSNRKRLDSMQSAQIRRHWIMEITKKLFFPSPAIYWRWVYATRTNWSLWWKWPSAHSMGDDCSGYILSHRHGQCASSACVYLFSYVIWLNFWFSIIPLLCFVFVWRLRLPKRRTFLKVYSMANAFCMWVKTVRQVYFTLFRF